MSDTPRDPAARPSRRDAEDPPAGDQGAPSPGDGGDHGTGRRNFLRAGLGAAGGLVAATTGAGKAAAAGGSGNSASNAITNLPTWTKYLGPGVEARPYGQPSKFEDSVVRRNVDWLTATKQSSVNFTPIYALEGFVTPNGICFERHHGGRADVDPAQHRLMVNGLVERELVFTLNDLLRMPQASRFYFLECAANTGMEWHGAQLNGVQFTHGMLHCVQYTGVTLRTLFREAGLKENAKWVLAEGADAAAMTRTIPLDKALDDCMVAYAQNGERLRPEQGYPLRLVVPGYEGNMWVKWLRRLEVGDKPYHTRWETATYTDLMPSGKARQFTWVMEPKSVITNPSPEMPLVDKGRQLLRGLAWSGHGKVKRVDISFDGGVNWRTAELQDPVLPRCLTRFVLPFEWNGEEMLVQSRVIDETDYVQPTITELHKARGTESIYHNNAIQTWLIKSTGEAENVHVA
jgi:sulfane dehydrogenase subunit SoxC